MRLRFPVQLADDEYVYWSSVVDAPVTDIMTEHQMGDFLLSSDARKPYLEPSNPVANDPDFERNDTFWYQPGVKVEGYNRAGENEAHITVEQMRLRYKTS